MSKQIPQKSRLGRGLSSLMNAMTAETSETSDVAAPVSDAVSVATEKASDRMPAGTAVLDVSVTDLSPNPHQPRRQFDETALGELAASLKTTGVIQPVIAREVGGGRFELIAGERRWRAAKIAGLTTLPVILKEVDPIMQAQMALVENLQRLDLNPIERASAYKTLLNNLGLTQGELADRLGENRSVIGHYLRLLELAPRVQEMIADTRLSFSHAKLLAGVTSHPEQVRLAELVISQGLNLRNLERLTTPVAAPEPAPAPMAARSAHLVDLEKKLSRHLGMRVQVRSAQKKGKGRLILHFASLDQFDDLMSKLGVSPEE
jgi:ParB family chromosome partitioning protein